jgi:hypothetical protein
MSRKIVTVSLRMLRPVAKKGVIEGVIGWDGQIRMRLVGPETGNQCCENDRVDTALLVTSVNSCQPVFQIPNWDMVQL